MPFCISLPPPKSARPGVLGEQRDAKVSAPAAEPEDGTRSRRRSAAAEAEEDEHDLYCLCQQPYNVDTAMISCDSCEEWYHLKCMGLTQSATRTIKKYMCPLCDALRGNKVPLEAALSKTRRTRYAPPGPPKLRSDSCVAAI